MLKHAPSSCRRAQGQAELDPQLVHLEFCVFVWVLRCSLDVSSASRVGGALWVYEHCV